MGLGLKAAVLAATVFLTGTAADAAYAQTVKARPGVVASDESRWGMPQAKKNSLQWSDRGRWGVNLDVEEPVRGVKPKDVEASAFFRIGPQLKVGGAVRLDDKAGKVERLRPEDREPRVRLETKFQF